MPDVKKLLQLSLEELMDIKVVTASGFLQTTAEAPSTITVITAQQIADRGYEELQDALRDVSGIDMIHLNGYAPTLIYFRGMYGAENLRALLMIDGIVENNIIGSNDMAGPANSIFLPRKYDTRDNFGSYLQYILNTKLLGKTNFTAGVRYIPVILFSANAEMGKYIQDCQAQAFIAKPFEISNLLQTIRLYLN